MIAYCKSVVWVDQYRSTGQPKTQSLNHAFETRSRKIAANPSSYSPSTVPKIIISDEWKSKLKCIYKELQFL